MIYRSLFPKLQNIHFSINNWLHTVPESLITKAESIKSMFSNYSRIKLRAEDHRAATMKMKAAVSTNHLIARAIVRATLARIQCMCVALDSA